MQTNRSLTACSLPAAVLALAAVAPLAGAQTVRFTRLGHPFPDFAYSDAYAVSADGSVVVGAASTGDTTGEAFRWTRAGGYQLMGDLLGGPTQSGAFACSADGSVLGGSGRGAANPSLDEACVWAGGTITPLGGVLPTGFFGSAVNGVSGNGLVRAGSFEHAAFSTQACVWNGVSRTDLGWLGSGLFTSSAAYAVSGSGLVVVGYSDSPVGSEAFKWTSAGGMVGLGGLPVPGSVLSQANACSADGSVVVGYSNNAAGRSEAVRWSGGTVLGLGDLPGGGFSSTARGVSADGTIIVGRATPVDPISDAFIWDATNGMRSLTQVLFDAGIDLTFQFELLAANAISADGKVIVGTGRRMLGGSEREAWVIEFLDAACPCVADFDGSGGTPDSGDIDAFFLAWLAGDPLADADCSGGTPDTSDIDVFFSEWLAGGC